jgi:hypothetical protein
MQAPSWYHDRLEEELQEVKNAKTLIEKLNETSDVYFSILRAHYDGFPVGQLPPFVVTRDTPVYAYMFTKFTLRWGFYRVAAFLCGAENLGKVREVVNRRKGSELRVVAARHQIDSEEFEKVGRRLRWVWTLLP